jgi:hypothetical protein
VLDRVDRSPIDNTVEYQIRNDREAEHEEDHETAAPFGQRLERSSFVPKHLR